MSRHPHEQAESPLRGGPSRGVVGAPSPAEERPTRVLGDYRGPRPGPLFVLVGGLHGNEPSGARAARRVAERLEREQLPLRGRVLCLAGNLRALGAGLRYVERDLNRIWSEGEIAAMLAGAGHDERAELRERRELHGVITRAIEEHDEAHGPVVLLDMHSTSAGGSPFTVIGDTLQNRAVAFDLPVPVILGLEETLDGALLTWLSEGGHVCIGFEGGRHDDADTVDNQLAAAWIVLVSAGGLQLDEVPWVRDLHRALKASAEGMPGVVEVRHRHEVREGDGFRMLPGFANFDVVAAERLLAEDREGEIRAAEDGLVLLPLYQGQGSDGYFLGREVRRVWLRLSGLLRRVGADRLAPWLPGVRRHPERPMTLLVDAHVARWWVVEIFHLLGYRKCRAHEGQLVFSRRVERAR